MPALSSIVIVLSRDADPHHPSAWPYLSGYELSGWATVSERCYNFVMIYLDYHASHPMLPCVQERINNLLTHQANPSSVHQAGQFLARQIDTVRDQLIHAVGMDDARVIFTSGATEATNMLLSLAAQQGFSVYAAQHEHVATLAHVPKNARIAVTPQGVIDLEDLQKTLAGLPTDVNPLVSLMAANNETALIQPIVEVSALVHQYRGLLHVDAVQGFARMPLDMRDLGIDYLSVSAHKIGGPCGIGALITPQALEPPALIKGGGQERGLRGGTENWLGIIGWGAALAWWQEHGAAQCQHLRALDQQLYALLKDTAVVWLGHDHPRVPGCALLLHQGTEAQSILMQLDLAGFAVSSGAACSSGRVSASHVLHAMGIPVDQASSAIRVSYGHATTQEHLQQFVAQYLLAITH